MPLVDWRTYRERARQKRKALHMLALSGVVRPSHIELRYTVPIMKGGAVNASFGARSATANQPGLSLAPIEESPSVVSSRGKSLLQWLRQGLTAPL
ncbi:MAG: hypothetical protein ACT4O4_00185 [Nitrospiraceae bacterium]